MADKITKIILLFLIVVSCTNCSVNKPIKEGLTGKVLWFEGDLMPGINKPPIKGIPIEREVFVYEKTSTTHCKLQGGFFCSNLETKLVSTTNSDAEGNFSVRLKPGTYSVFIKEEGGLFAKTFNENGIINPVIINPGEVTETVIRVDYKAAY